MPLTLTILVVLVFAMCGLAVGIVITEAVNNYGK